MTKTPTTRGTLKVYGWTGARRRPDTPYNQSQSREIVAARSGAEARRITGITRTYWEQSAAETGNADELETALAKPGVVFWRPLNDRDGDPWDEVTS